MSYTPFDAIQIGIASPEMILSWSHGEVKKPETINYRTLKPERDGLFCERIFGPTKDWECHCGKYKKIRYKGKICDRCGVEITKSKVRRERMGHIELAAPVSHIWYFKGIPSRMGLLLDMTPHTLEKVLYFASYIVTDPGSTPLKRCDLLSEKEYRDMREKYEDDFQAGMGAEAIKKLLEEIDCEQLSHDLREELKSASGQKKAKIVKRLEVVEAFRQSGNKPSWMIIDILPVIPPEIRPMVQLDGGRFATSDLNDLYRRVINRNNRLKRLIQLSAPDIIVRNEKRMLQEAVDSLIDNGRRGRAVTGANSRALKSLSDMLKGKQGRFRQNLLGKRVDYSGRSVICVGPYLKIHQCGLPKKMALELFKPFIYAELEKRGLASTIKSARKMVEREELVVWDILADVVKEYPVMLNRAPTLHRLGIQAFEPLLVEGKAIRLHPLVCTAYNADFDGDQMAVHIPLSVEAQIECRVLMMSTNNILSPASGSPIIVPSQDMVLGLYYMTSMRRFEPGEGMTFCAPWEVESAYDQGIVSLQSIVKVRMNDGKIYETTPGRVLVGELLPPELPFENVNLVLTKKAIAKLVDTAYKTCGIKGCCELTDKIKNMGYEFATRSGISIGLKDMLVPHRKPEILAKSQKEVDEIESQYREGIITKTEKYNKVVDVWQNTATVIAKEVNREISHEKRTNPKTGETVEDVSFNSLYMMTNSGARGNQDQLRQISGMRGLMAKPNGEIIETPITASFREGLSVLQYFTSTHGARKGLADTALKTANSGYLTRRLVDVVQDVVVSEYDCRTVDGIELTNIVKDGAIQTHVWDRAFGRVCLYPVMDPQTQEQILPENTLIGEKEVNILKEHGVSSITVRSPLTCRARHGICALCYGRDLARGHLVNIGETVGIMAAQSIGEPGTQLTMRTFHIGGTASSKAEKNKLEAVNPGRIILYRIHSVRNTEGEELVLGRSSQVSIVDAQDREIQRENIPSGAHLMVKDGQEVSKGDVLATWDPYNEPFICEEGGQIRFTDIIDGKTVQEKVDNVTSQTTLTIMEFRSTNYRPAISIVDPATGEILKRRNGTSDAIFNLPVGAIVMVKDGDMVNSGDIIARRPRETSKTKDITGGLPRVAELFEVRKPKDMAVVSEIAGTVSYGGESKGKRRLIVTPEIGEPKEYLVPRGKHITASDGDYVDAGDPLTEGSPELHDILRTKGEKYLASYLVNEIQEVYRNQGVAIDDKHFETIVRQMLRKVTVIDPGQTTLLEDEQIDKTEFAAVNEKAIAEGRKPATAEPLVLGITQASLTTSSFISAASFQETTKVLTEAALRGKYDYLSGLKENVIVGRLIPAGTGLRKYIDSDILVPEQKERPDKFLEELEKDPILADVPMQQNREQPFTDEWPYQK